VRRLEVRGLDYLLKQPFTELARRVLAVPVEGGRKRRVVPVGRRRLLLLELRLRPDVRAQEGFVGVLIR
jgi:hypothetical protein